MAWFCFIGAKVISIAHSPVNLMNCSAWASLVTRMDDYWRSYLLYALLGALGHMNELQKHGFTQQCRNITHGARTVSGVNEMSGERSEHLRELRDSISSISPLMHQGSFHKRSKSLKGDQIVIRSPLLGFSFTFFFCCQQVDICFKTRDTLQEFQEWRQADLGKKQSQSSESSRFSFQKSPLESPSHSLDSFPLPSIQVFLCFTGLWEASQHPCHHLSHLQRGRAGGRTGREGGEEGEWTPTKSCCCHWGMEK